MRRMRFTFILGFTIAATLFVTFSLRPSSLASGVAGSHRESALDQTETWCKSNQGRKHSSAVRLLSYFLLGDSASPGRAWGKWLDDGRRRAGAVSISSLQEVKSAGRSVLTGTAQTVDVDTPGAGGDRAFSPSVVVINVGDSVRWIFNAGGHNVVSGSSCVNDNQFCSSNDSNCSNNPNGNVGTSYTHVFNSPGTFNYFCRPHCSEGMSGTVIVQASSSPTPTPTPTPSPTATPTPTPTPNTIQLSSGSYNVNEGDGLVTITVNRTGDSSGVASVAYATGDLAGSQSCSVFNGYASSRCDYISALGTISFAAGETSKTITVHIIDDSYAEGNEFFNISLSNPSGASLGTPSTGFVTITDNDNTTGVNPVDSQAFYVREQYLDFLNREPDSSGLNFWTNEITSCGSDQSCVDLKRINVSAAFFLSIEFQQTGYLVERIYKSAFADASGTSTFNGTHQLAVPVVRFNEFLSDTQEIGQGVVVGVGDWQQALEANKQAFTTEFVQRAQFTRVLSTTLSPTDFVNDLFMNAGVVPSSSDRNSAIAEFNSATDTTDLAARGRALRDVAENSSLNQQEFNRAFVLMQFFGYLRRNPNDSPDADYTGFDFWLAKLNQFNGDFVSAEMVKAFINSDEYRKRFGT